MRTPTFILLLTTMSFLIYGCEVKEPGKPKWQTELTVPIADHTYTVEDIAVDSSYADSNRSNWVSVSGDSLYANYQDTINPTPLDGVLSNFGYGESIINEVGVRTVESPGSQINYVDVSAMDPLKGLTVPIAPFTIPETVDSLDPYPNYEWAILEWGDMTISVTNNLPIPLENMHIEIWALDPHILVGYADVPGTLQPGATYNETHPILRNQVIDNIMETHITATSPGSSTPVFVPMTINIEIDVALSALGVINALAHIPQQDFDEDTLYALGEPNIVREAVISGGTVSYTMTNRTAFISTVMLELLDFTKDGEAFTDSAKLGPNQIYTMTGRDISGYRLYRPQMDNMAHAHVKCRILDTADPEYGIPNGLVITSADSTVLTDYQISDLTFTSFEGVLGNAEIEIDQSAQVLEDMPGGLDSLDVEILYNHLYLSSIINAESFVDLALLAYKGGQVVETYNLPHLTVPAGTITNPGILDTVFTGDQAILNIMPDSIKPLGTILVDGYVNVADWQYIEGKVHLFSPFSFIIGESTLEPEQTKIDEGFENQLTEVELSISLVNHIPLSGQALVLASYDSNEFRNAYSSEVDTFMVLNLPAPTLDSWGYVVEPGMTEMNEILDANELQMFADASADKPLYFQTFVVINSTQGDTIRVKPDDHITVGASAHIHVDVNSDK